MPKVIMQIMPGGSFKIVRTEGYSSQAACKSAVSNFEKLGYVDESSREDRPGDVQVDQHTDVTAGNG